MGEVNNSGHICLTRKGDDKVGLDFKICVIDFFMSFPGNFLLFIFPNPIMSENHLDRLH